MTDFMRSLLQRKCHSRLHGGVRKKSIGGSKRGHPTLPAENFRPASVSRRAASRHLFPATASGVMSGQTVGKVSSVAPSYHPR